MKILLFSEKGIELGAKIILSLPSSECKPMILIFKTELEAGLEIIIPFFSKFWERYVDLNVALIK